MNSASSTAAAFSEELLPIGLRLAERLATEPRSPRAEGKVWRDAENAVTKDVESGGAAAIRPPRTPQERERGEDRRAGDEIHDQRAELAVAGNVAGNRIAGPGAGKKSHDQIDQEICRDDRDDDLPTRHLR